MSIKVKDDLRELARHLSSRATYSDAMYELYVRMKVAQGRDDADRNRVQQTGWRCSQNPVERFRRLARRRLEK